MMKSMILILFGLFFSMAVYADEPTTIARVRGKAGIAERVESRGKAAKENVVRVRLNKTIGDVVVQERTVVKGMDAFDSRPKPERKSIAKERPLPASVKPQVIEVGKGRVGK